MNNIGTINPSLSVELKSDYIKITNINQNISFIIDSSDIGLVYSGCSMLSVSHNGISNIFIYNYNNSNSITSIEKILLNKEILEFESTYNTEASVIHIDNDNYNCRRNNLKIIPKIDLLSYIKNNKSIGVYELPSGNWRMKITNPETKEIISNVYSTKIEAAIAYDNLANEFYPNANKTTNFSLGVYSDADYNNTTINKITRSSNTGYKGVNFNKNRNSYDVRVYETTKDNNTKLRCIASISAKKINDQNFDNEMLKLAIIKEEWIANHPECTSESNLEYPKNSEGKLIIAGILKPKNNL